MDSTKRFLNRYSAYLPEERPNRLVRDGKVDITEILEVHIYRHGHIVFCRGCRKVIGEFNKLKGKTVSKWIPYVCQCSNYDFLCYLDYTEAIREALFTNCRGRLNVTTFNLSEGSGGLCRKIPTFLRFSTDIA